MHSAYETCRQVQARRQPASDPSLVEWDELLLNLKDSNRNQADSIVEKLRQIGCALRKVEGQASRMKFTDAEIETMAEMEHGRWIVELLEDGWKWGRERDIFKNPAPIFCRGRNYRIV